MRRISFLIIVFLGSFPAISQNLHVTFSASTDSIAVDSVLATNLDTDQSILLPGDETLILEQSSGVNDLLHSSDIIGIYPNPFNGNANLFINRKEAGSAIISVHNHIGQVLYQSNEYLEAGGHSFSLSLNKAGIYFITISGNEGVSSLKAICTQTGKYPLGISYAGNSVNGNLKAGYKALSQPDEYKLAYSSDQVIHFECYGGKYTTIFTDTVEASNNYDVEFVDCTDPDGRTYNIVKIGNQFWMEENLAYLPTINNPEDQSPNSPYYYVYGYEGASVEMAKERSNYFKYGVLYNWAAAKIACPDGWHLPSDEEWQILERYLGMSFYDVSSNGNRFFGEVGKKLKSVTGWFNNNDGDNSSGFNCLPGGYRYQAYSGKEGGFEYIETWAGFSTSSPKEMNMMWIRGLSYENNGVDRYYSNVTPGYSVRCIKNE